MLCINAHVVCLIALLLSSRCDGLDIVRFESHDMCDCDCRIDGAVPCDGAVPSFMQQGMSMRAKARQPLIQPQPPKMGALEPLPELPYEVLPGVMPIIWIPTPPPFANPPPATTYPISPAAYDAAVKAAKFFQPNLWTTTTTPLILPEALAHNNSGYLELNDTSFHEVFLDLDTDRNGKVSKHEFHAALEHPEVEAHVIQKLGFSYNEESKIYHDIDADNSTEIDEEELRFLVKEVKGIKPAPTEAPKATETIVKVHEDKEPAEVAEEEEKLSKEDSAPAAAAPSPSVASATAPAPAPAPAAPVKVSKDFRKIAREVFRRLDINEDGKINTEEFEEAFINPEMHVYFLEKEGFGLSDAFRAFKEAESLGSELDEEEFVQVCLKVKGMLPDYREIAREVFTHVDINENGKINTEEFLEALGNGEIIAYFKKKEGFGLSDAFNAFREADSLGRELDVEEFIEITLKVKGKLEPKIMEIAEAPAGLETGALSPSASPPASAPVPVFVEAPNAAPAAEMKAKVSLEPPSAPSPTAAPVVLTTTSAAPVYVAPPPSAAQPLPQAAPPPAAAEPGVAVAPAASPPQAPSSAPAAAPSPAAAAASSPVGDAASLTLENMIEAEANKEGSLAISQAVGQVNPNTQRGSLAISRFVDPGENFNGQGTQGSQEFNNARQEFNNQQFNSGSDATPVEANLLQRKRKNQQSHKRCMCPCRK